jgi:hypothetical protein
MSSHKLRILNPKNRNILNKYNRLFFEKLWSEVEKNIPIYKRMFNMYLD